jgi:hypothetical protein
MGVNDHPILCPPRTASTSFWVACDEGSRPGPRICRLCAHRCIRAAGRARFSSTTAAGSGRPDGRGDRCAAAAQTLPQPAPQGDGRGAAAFGPDPASMTSTFADVVAEEPMQGHVDLRGEPGGGPPCWCLGSPRPPGCSPGDRVPASHLTPLMWPDPMWSLPRKGRRRYGPRRRLTGKTRREPDQAGLARYKPQEHLLGGFSDQPDLCRVAGPGARGPCWPAHRPPQHRSLR